MRTRAIDPGPPPMARIAYYRLSAGDDPLEEQRRALGGNFDRQFKDEAIAHGIPAISRAGLQAALAYVGAGDTLHVVSLDRLGRDALDVLASTRALFDKGAALQVLGLGRFTPGGDAPAFTVLAQLAELERVRIVERTSAGRARARESLAETGLTHRGKASLGRPTSLDPAEVAAWRRETQASIAGTAAHFGLSVATVKRYCASAATAATASAPPHEGPRAG